MPNVDNEHKSYRVAVVPDFVLKRVVKYYKLAFDPLSCLVGHSDPWAGRHDEAKMGTDPAVSWTSMWPDMNDWMHH